VDNVADLPFKLVSHESCPECKDKIAYTWSYAPQDFRVGRCPHCGYVLVIVALPFNVCGRMGPVPLRASEYNTIGAERVTAENLGVYINITADVSESVKA